MLIKQLLAILAVIGSVLFSQFSATYSQFTGTDSALEALSTPKDLLVYTAEGAAGEPYGGVSVLYAELNGAKVDTDFWGTGKLDKLVFKVGTKSGEHARLFVGEREIKLTPMDVITLRHFEGNYGVSNAGTTRAELHLDGTMRSAVFAESDLKRVATNAQPGTRQSAEAAAAGAAFDDGTTKIAFVYIDGLKETGVELNPGGFSRLYTERTIGQDETKNLPVQWAKVEGKLLEGYTYLDQPIGTIEFLMAGQNSEVTPVGEASVVFDQVHFDLSASFAYSSPVEVTDFIGVLTFFKVGPREARLSLDGYATGILPDPVSESRTVGLLGSPICPVGPEPCFFAPPSMQLDYLPLGPLYTRMDITFIDNSVDPDGVIVLSRFYFGDGGTNADLDVDSDDPAGTDLGRDTPVTVVHATHTDLSGLGITVKHSYADDGVYTVTLVDTDNTLLSNSTNITLTILNRAPTASFAFSPTFPLDRSPIQFTDTSVDVDGAVVARLWDFGDGNVSTGQNPVHEFFDDGNYTINLTVTDDDGESASTSVTIYVGNQAPRAHFLYSPAVPVTGQSVQFMDNSTDVDGAVVSFEWDFGDGGTSTALNPAHTYTNSGTYVVSLNVIDDDGSTGTTSASITVLNRAPEADFSWSPAVASKDQPVNFTQEASDPDGVVASYSWNFGDGGTSTLPNPTHVFTATGVFAVTLTVTDDDGASGTMTRSVVVNRPPTPSFTASTATAHAGEPIYFNATGRDPDGTIVAWEWTFGDGANASGERTVHAYAASGNYLVKLTVTDDVGASASASVIIHVSNWAPVSAFTYDPAVPEIGETVTFTDASSDADGTIVNSTWAFSNTGTPKYGAVVTHSFAGAGTFTITLTVRDNSGGSSSTSHTLRVNAPPIADFDAPQPSPRTGQLAAFSSTSLDVDGTIVDHSWDFGDASGASGRDVTHSFAAIGTYIVTLTATDNDGASASMSRNVTVVNGGPTADFTVATSLPLEGAPVVFLDASTDPEGLPLTYFWTFGDGENSTDASPSHTFAVTGAYTVRLTVTDSEGATSTKQRTITAYGATSFSVSVRFVHSPGDAPFDLTNGNYSVRFTESATGVVRESSAASISVTASGWANASFAPGEWAGGDGLAVRLTVLTVPANVDTQLSMSAATRAILRDPLRISLARVYAIQLDQDTDVGLLASSVGALSPPEDPLAIGSLDQPRTNTYHDARKPITGNLTVRFIDGVAAAGVRQVIDVAYIGAFRTAPGTGTVVPPALTQTRLTMSLETDGSGRAAFTVAFDAPGADADEDGQNEIDGAYLPGWHKLTFRHTVVGSGVNLPPEAPVGKPLVPQTSTFVNADFYVSPEGGLTGLRDAT